ncbi:DUF3316 domain-containing protein [Psychromonas sp. KJ10-10]|uniref:DUF3316 domain-containing protein n=1 Tax=Psychromonas sp. KJ10-10 TaxID=3391823 RepID=UPI0039B44764
MKMIKNALMASAMVLLSSQVFAFDTAETTEVIKTAQVSSKAVAYEVALDKLETLQNSSAD